MLLLKVSEKIRDHLTKQKARSVGFVGDAASGASACRYLATGETGPLMCAVGCLITKDAYDFTIENKGIKYTGVVQALEKSLHITLNSSYINLLDAWQCYHDAHYTHMNENFSYKTWLQLGARDDCKHSPASMQQYLVMISKYRGWDLTGLVTKQYLEHISLYIKNHLLKQGQQSLLPNSTTSCAYRGIGGTMCAVGCLIADEHYNEDDMEGDNLNSIHVRQAIVESLGVDRLDMVDESQALYMVLRTWQRYHDSNTTFDQQSLSRMHTEIMLRLDDKLAFPNLPE